MKMSQGSQPQTNKKNKVHIPTTQAYTKEYMQAMEKMHGPMMDGIMNENPDMAFIKGMLPHHQGAVAMAKIELQYGKDKELKEFASQLVDMQDKQIDFMNKWLSQQKDKQ